MCGLFHKGTYYLEIFYNLVKLILHYMYEINIVKYEITVVFILF